MDCRIKSFLTHYGRVSNLSKNDPALSTQTLKQGSLGTKKTQSTKKQKKRQLPHHIATVDFRLSSVSISANALSL
jgi:hypothetical protein